MPSLLDPDRQHDMGQPDPAVREALARAAASTPETLRTDHLDAVIALCTARLLMPVMDHDGELGAVRLTNDQGRTALLAFTGIDSLTAWNATARPVPGHLDDLAATVAEVQADVLLIDVAGPSPFVVGPDLLGSLEQGMRLVKIDGGYGWLSVTGEA